MLRVQYLEAHVDGGLYLDHIKARRAARDLALVQRAREDPNVYVEIAGMVEGRKYIGRQHPVHRAWQDHFTRGGPHGFTQLLAHVGSAKALPVDTAIAVPGGWRPIGELRVGDLVIGGDGLPTKVAAVSPTWADRDVYELDFDDGSSLRADGEHLWSAWTTTDRDQGRPPRTVTTLEIVERFTRRNGTAFWRIPLTAPVEHPHRDLPVHPYVLGVWLGDGATDCTRITCHEDDIEIVDRCIALEGERCGERKYKPGTRVVYQVVGGVTDKHHNHDPLNLRGRLRALGVLGDKHVPAEYLTASVEQRRELLAGLMDTDGTVCRQRGRVTFPNTNERLARAVLELARSLGYKATIISGPAKLRGKVCGTVWRVGWTTKDIVFRLRRKADMQAAWVARREQQARALPPGRLQRNTWDARVVVAWRKVESVPVRCIAVEAEHHTYVATPQYVVTHNSTQIHRWRVIHELGRNPNLRVGLVSATKDLPKNFLMGIKADIEGNPWLHAVFPHLRRGTRHGQKNWSTESIHIDRSDIVPDPTIQVMGLGSRVLGKRLDLVIFDDVLNTENTLTGYMCDRVWTFCNDEVMSRAAPGMPFRAWWLGHPWTRDDGCTRFAALPGCRVLRHGARMQRLPDGTLITSADRRFNENLPWTPLLDNFFTIEKLAAKYAAAGRAARHMLDCQEKDGGSNGIKGEYLANALTRGRGLPLVRQWSLGDSPTYAGFDIGFGEGGDFSAYVVATVYGDGTRRILEIKRGQWTGPQILEVLADIHRRFGCLVGVEANQAQRFIRQFARVDAASVPIKDLFTGSNKHGRFGVLTLEAELGPTVADCRWMFPRPEDWFEPADEMIQELISEAINYDPHRHAGDVLMAWWHCREMIRMAEGA